MFPPSGPTLPDFSSSSILVHGPFHCTAPLHWAISQTSRDAESSVILLTPSRQRFAQALLQFNDQWVLENSGHGPSAGVSSRIRTFYPPSLAHMAFLLSTLMVPKPGQDISHVENKFILEQQPVAVVLHDLSHYFLREEDATVRRKWTVGSYLSIIARLFALAHSLSGGSSNAISVALFDSGIDELQLPLQLYNPIPTNDTAKLARRFFVWHALYSRVEVSDESRSTLQIHKSAITDAQFSVHWREVKRDLGLGDGVYACTEFMWETSS